MLLVLLYHLLRKITIGEDVNINSIVNPPLFCYTLHYGKTDLRDDTLGCMVFGDAEGL